MERKSNKNDKGVIFQAADEAISAPKPGGIIALNAEWHAGPRSPEWDELWRRILCEIFVIAGKPDHAENKKEVSIE